MPATLGVSWLAMRHHATRPLVRRMQAIDLALRAGRWSTGKSLAPGAQGRSANLAAVQDTTISGGFTHLGLCRSGILGDWTGAGPRQAIKLLADEPDFESGTSAILVVLETRCSDT